MGIAESACHVPGTWWYLARELCCNTVVYWYIFPTVARPTLQSKKWYGSCLHVATLVHTRSTWYSVEEPHTSLQYGDPAYLL